MCNFQGPKPRTVALIIVLASSTLRHKGQSYRFHKLHQVKYFNCHIFNNFPLELVLEQIGFGSAT